MKQRKLALMGLSLVLVLVLLAFLWSNFYHKSDLVGTAIELETYRAYDSYGFPYEDEELEVFVWLDQVLDREHFVESLKTENHTIYLTTDAEDRQVIGAMLNKAKDIREIAYSEAIDGDGQLFRSYWVDYLDLDGNRVVVEYYSNGRARKTIGYVQEGRVVALDNELTMSTYYMDLTKDNPLIYKEDWLKVEGQEFSNDDDGAGRSLYFYQVASDAYCSFMVYGSGLESVLSHTSEVYMEEDGTWTIHLPKNLLSDDRTKDQGTLVAVQLKLGEDYVTMEGRVFHHLPYAPHKDLIIGKSQGDKSFNYTLEGTLSAYALSMSSTPGLPMKSTCYLEDPSLDLSLIYEVDQGDLMIYDGQYIQQVGKTTSMDFDTHMIYWTPLTEGFSGIEDQDVYANLTVQVVNNETGKIEGTEVHTILQDKGYFALDLLPVLPTSEHVIQEGFAVYPLEDYQEIGPYPQAPEGSYIIGPTPFFTLADLASVDFDRQIYTFTEAFLDKVEPHRSSLAGDDQETFSGDMEGSVILGKNNHSFVVVVDGESIYEGFFDQSVWSSFMPMGPVIYDVEDQGIRIDYTMDDGHDPRFDPRIKEALREKIQP